MREASKAAIMEDAARWFAARRRGVMEVEERANFVAWLRDPAHAVAMAELERIWLSLDGGDVLAPPALVAEARPVTRTAMVAVACAASVAVSLLSAVGDGAFWRTLDWMSR